MILTVGACGRSSHPAASTTSTTVPSSTTSGSTTTVAAGGTGSGATNLSAGPDVQAALLAAVAAMHQLPVSDYAGLVPGSTYYAVDHGTGDYWAGVAPMPQPSSVQAQVSSQDDGSYVILTRPPGGGWHGWETGAARGADARCPVTIPADVLAVWNWSPGTCTPPPSASVPTTSVAPTTSTPSAGALPTASFADWTGREPTTIAFSGDATNIVSDLTWSWTATGATGHGTWTFESCDPNCAAGSQTPYPATVTLSDPVGGQFTRGVEQTSGPYGSTNDFTLPSRFIDAS